MAFRLNLKFVQDVEVAVRMVEEFYEAVQARLGDGMGGGQIVVESPIRGLADGV